MKSNLYRILLENKRVNHYTKLLIMLNTYNHFKDYYIPNKKLTRILKIDKKNLIVLLHQLQDDNIIKLYYVGKKRYFKFNLEEEKKTNDIFHYDWLEEDIVEYLQEVCEKFCEYYDISNLVDNSENIVIKNIKEIIIKSIVDKRLTLEDGVNRLQSEIKTRILKEETLNKDIWDTYSFIIEDLKRFDTKDIDIIMQVLFNKDMTILINKYYKDKIQKDDIKYELYIALKDVDDEFEIVLKKSEDNRFVSFLKKNCNDSNIVEEYLITMEEFYTKYYRFVDYLDKAIFKGIRVFVQDFSLSPQKSILLFYIDGIAIVLMENEEVLILKDNKFFLKEPYGLMSKAEQYKDKQVFYDKIYNSFFERKEEIKLKREKNE